MNALKTWFASISEREQKLVIAGAVIGTLGMFYFLVWSPIHSAIETQRSALATEKQTLAWVNEQANRAQVLRRSVSKTSFNGSLTQLVNRTTRSSGIPVARMQPQGDELQVWIDQVAFNDLMAWLEQLEQQGVMIIQSDVSEVDLAGFVKVQRLQLGKA
jgi:general secretion pathway protein M